MDDLHDLGRALPLGEFRINVSDPDGRPVKNVILRVYHGGTRTPAFGYPLDNYTRDEQLVSDDSGKIVATREKGGLQFGGRCWHLFWVIPVGECRGPEYEGEISADGFRALTFPIGALFSSDYLSYEDFPKTKRRVADKEVELPVYEHTFTLER